MIEPTALLLPLGIWATLKVASSLGGGSDMDYRQHEQRSAYAQRRTSQSFTDTRG